MIEITDGIEVLLSLGCAVPAVPLLRSSLEALLSMDYILQNESSRVQRSRAWYANYIRNRLELHLAIDPHTSEGRRFRKRIATDKLATVYDFTNREEIVAIVRRKANRYKQILAGERFSQVESERTRMTKRTRNPHWYSLFNGPQRRYPQRVCKKLKAT